VGTTSQTGGAWLDGHTRQWVDVGLISEGQADAITQFERRTDDTARPDRLGLGTEVAVYLGSVLAIMGGAVLVGRNWRELEMPGRLGIAVVISVVGFLAGSWLTRLGEERTNRLGSFLWVIGTGGVALGIGAVLAEFDPEPGAAALMVGLPVLALGAMLWRNLDRPLQMLTTAVGLGVTIGGVIEISDLRVWVGGIVVWALSVVTAVGAASGAIRPRLVALLTAAVGAMFGAMMLGELDEHLGPAAATVTAAGVVVFALVDRSIPVLVVGVLGFLFATEALLATTFTGQASSLIVTVVGLAVVVVAVVRSVRGAGP